MDRLQRGPRLGRCRRESPQFATGCEWRPDVQPDNSCRPQGGPCRVALAAEQARGAGLQGWRRRWRSGGSPSDDRRAPVESVQPQLPREGLLAGVPGQLFLRRGTRLARPQHCRPVRHYGHHQRPRVPANVRINTPFTIPASGVYRATLANTSDLGDLNDSIAPRACMSRPAQTSGFSP